MNKGRRNEITKLKHKKRCKVFGIKPELNYCYKAQGVPCSCAGCVGGKFKRKPINYEISDNEYRGILEL